MRRYLHEIDPHWRQAIEALIDKVQERTASFAADEIEADITAAADSTHLKPTHTMHS